MNVEHVTRISSPRETAVGCIRCTVLLLHATPAVCLFQRSLAGGCPAQPPEGGTTKCQALIANFERCLNVHQAAPPVSIITLQPGLCNKNGVRQVTEHYPGTAICLKSRASVCSAARIFSPCNAGPCPVTTSSGSREASRPTERCAASQSAV